jgi:predicted nucleotidyltransferase
MLKKENILAKLKEYKKSNSQIVEIGIFGSYARDEASEKSDIDIFVKLKKSNLFLLSRIKLDLEEILNLKVDLIEIREKMNNFLKNRIQKEAISA